MNRIASLVAVVWMGCTPGDASCVPGRVEICPCPSGRIGAQSCQADGTFGACVCPDDVGADEDASTPVDAFIVDAPSDVPSTLDAADDAGMPDAGVAPRGHVVLIGHPNVGWDEYRDRLILNAVFLSERVTTTVRIIEYLEYDDPLVGSVSTHPAIEPEAAARGLSVSFTPLTSSAGLASLLPSNDVLLVYPQSSATTAQLQDVADAWRDQIVAFARSGGVVVILATAAHRGPGGVLVPGDEYRIVSGPDLFTFPREPFWDFRTPPTPEVAEPTDPIAAGVLPYNPGGTQCYFNSSGGTTVIRSNSTSTPAFCPLVRHLVF